ncbi:DNA-binding protein HU [Tribonema minus]|uniref:DNA-binding protein HU n=1 Tax=Tribonema minus TaxID=303371 RepID=A0A835Z9S8_9STRA|nr:DNA-binding protein HU [Tribonema minus]
MKKADFVASISAKSGLSKTQTDAAISAFMDTVMEAVADGKKVSLVGFGTFESRERAARQGRNPQTGEALSIPASKAPAFSAAKAFKDRVKEAR